MKSIKQPTLKHVADRAAAADLYARPVLTPSVMPKGVSAPPVYRVVSQGQGSFTFSAEKARQTVSKTGGTLPPLPANIDSTTLFLTAGPAVLQTYGEHPMSTPAPETQGAGDFLSALPQLIVLQSASPVVSTTGASIQDLQAALAAMPGIPPDLAAQIRAIQDPASTLPIPVPTGSSSHQVTVKGPAGGPGLLVGDNTGVGAAVIWQSHGQLYVVAGTLTQDDIMAVADSLG
jgi:hypothetical protein